MRTDPTILPTTRRALARRGPSRRGIARRALTLAELIVALAMFGVIAMAVSSFALAVAAGWRNGDDAFRLANLANRSGNRVQDVIGKMRYVAQAMPATTAGTRSHLFYWAGDATVADGKAQLGEMALLEYDPATRAIWLYEPIATAKMTAGQLATASGSDWGDPASASIVAFFKSLDLVGPRTIVIGGQNGASAVTAASFTFAAAGNAKPIVTYSLQLAQNAAVTASEGSIVLHAALVPRNF